ncbi:hypothetical protein VTK26DRAFT_5338 [Humicola hyalothermophila]
MDAFGDDVSDSTDWIGTPLAGLMAVEQAFRCHLCKDFYNSPMITSCNHTFCSICIRRCLSVEGKCPLCRASDQESKLRGNWALREAVDAFVKSRDDILRFAKAPTAAERSGSPKRKAADTEVSAEERQVSKRPRMATRSSKTKAAEATAAMMQAEYGSPETEDTGHSEPEPNDGLVACPICLTRMKPWQVDRHIDTTCPGSPQPQNTSSTPSDNSFGSARMSLQNPPTPTKPQKPPERLPALAYSMLKDTALRKKMAELGLSTAGSRQMLERRHQEWVTIWNANCDSARPKKRSELLQDLEVWERTMGTRAPTMSRAAAMGARIKDKEFDGNAWAAEHGDSFKALIAQARKSKEKATQKVVQDGHPDQGSSRGDAAPADGERMVESAPQPVPKHPDSPAIIDLAGSTSNHSPLKHGGSAQANKLQTESIRNSNSSADLNAAPP